MLINRFREDDVQVTGQKLDGGGARFEIFFNGQCVFSKVVYDILFNTLKNDRYTIYFSNSYIILILGEKSYISGFWRSYTRGREELRWHQGSQNA